MENFQTNKTNAQISVALEGGLKVPEVERKVTELSLEVYGKKNIKEELKSGGFYNTSGTFVSGNGVYTERIDISGAKKIEINWNGNASARSCVFFDSNGSKIFHISEQSLFENYKGKTYTRELPSNASYCLLSFSVSSTYSVVIFKESIREEFDGKLGGKVDKIEGEGLISESFSKTIDVKQSSEYYFVEVDAGGRIVSGSKIDGTKYINKLIVDSILSKGNKTTVSKLFADAISPTTNSEWKYAVLDENDKVVCGIRTDGTFYFGKGIPSHVVDFVVETAKKYGGYDNKIKAEITNKGYSDSKNELKNSIGLFANLVYYNLSDTYNNNILDSILKGGFNFISINLMGAYISEESTLRLNKLIKMCNDRGIEVLLCYTYYPNINGNSSADNVVSTEDWIKTISYIARNYDGMYNKNVIDEGGNTSTLFVKYYYFLDEMALSYDSKYRYTINDCLDVQALAYYTVKNFRNDAVVGSTTFPRYDKTFIQGILNARTSEKDYRIELLNDMSDASKGTIEYFVSINSGLKFADAIDVLFLDTYANIQGEYPELMEKVVANIYNDIYNIQPEVAKKRMWNCCSTSLYNVDKMTQAAFSVREYLMAMSLGAESFLHFGLFVGQNTPNNNREDFWGIAYPSVKNSYLSIFDNNMKPLSDGDSSERLYLHFPTQIDRDYIQFDMTATISSKLKSGGCSIKGRNVTVTKVSYVNGNGTETVIRNGNFRFNDYGSASLYLEPSLFTAIGTTGGIKFECADFISSCEWDKFEPIDSFVAISTLSKFLNDGCTKPIISQPLSGVYVASWFNANRKPIFAVWGKNEVICNIEYEGERIDVYNYDMTKYVISNNELRVSMNPKFIKNVLSLTLK